MSALFWAIVAGVLILLELVIPGLVTVWFGLAGIIMIFLAPLIKNTSIEGSKKESAKTQTANGNQKISHAENKPTIYYKVQIAALKNETADLDTPELRKIGKLSLVNQKDVNKYLVGDFISRESAEIAREKLKNLGYKGAFIVLLQEWPKMQIIYHLVEV